MQQARRFVNHNEIKVVVKKKFCKYVKKYCHKDTNYRLVREYYFSKAGCQMRLQKQNNTKFVLHYFTNETGENTRSVAIAGSLQQMFSIYHASEQCFSRTLIGQLGDDSPSTTHLRAAEEKQNGFPFQIKFLLNK